MVRQNISGGRSRYGSGLTLDARETGACIAKADGQPVSEDYLGFGTSTPISVGPNT